MSFAYGLPAAMHEAIHPRVLAAAPALDCTLLGAGRLSVEAPHPEETVPEALARFRPDALLLDAGALTPELAEDLYLPSRRHLPIVLLVDHHSTGPAGLALGIAQARFASSLASLEELRETLLGLAAFDGQAHEGPGWLSVSETPHLASLRSAIAAPPAIDATRIKGLIRARRARDRYFSPELFADPAWDILLDLTAAELDGDRVSVSALCTAAHVPTTTALRWIKRLCDDRLLVRVEDPADRRRVFVALTPETSTRMRLCLQSFAGVQQPL